MGPVWKDESLHQTVKSASAGHGRGRRKRTMNILDKSYRKWN